jgi:hypothetical protein
MAWHPGWAFFIETLVAVGTLSLAAVTAWLAFVSRNATQEAYRARVDSSGPRLVVHTFDVGDKPVTRPITAAVINLIIQDTSGSIDDQCEMRFGAQALMPKIAQDGWMIAGQRMSSVVPNPPPDPVAVTGLMRRSYPDEQQTKVRTGRQ